jgi:hypothetical protein
MNKELTIAVAKAEEALRELLQRLRKVTELSLTEESSDFKAGLILGVVSGVHQFLNNAKEEPI